MHIMKKIYVWISMSYLKYFHMRMYMSPGLSNFVMHFSIVLF